MLAGLVGAVAASYGLVLFDPSVPTDGLTTALAGALWLAGIVEVYSSRRRRGEGGESRVAESDGSPSALHTPAYDVTRQALVGALLEDATAQEAGRYEEIGRELPSIRHAVSRQERSRSSRGTTWGTITRFSVAKMICTFVIVRRRSMTLGSSNLTIQRRRSDRVEFDQARSTW